MGEGIVTAVAAAAPPSRRHPMIVRAAVAASLLVPSLAFAGVDLRTTLTAPVVSVYQTGKYTVSVKNTGSSSAANVSLIVQLPETGTSPTVYVMGTLGVAPGCVPVGTTLSCALGTIGRNKTKTVTFDLALPEATTPLEVVAVASTPGVVDTNVANNTSAVTPALSHPTITVVPDVDVLNEHCTGTGLTSFFECVVSPGSISSHDATFHGDGSISFAYPELGGSWSQPTLEQLHFEYTELGLVVMTFDGWAVDAACWEGVVLAGGYTIPYSVCLN